MRDLSRLSCVMGLVLGAVGVSIALGADDDWPRYGHDGALTGRSPLKGQIISPRLAWTRTTAGRQLTIEAVPSPDGDKLIVPGRSTTQPALPTVRMPGPSMLDIEGTGTLRPAAETFHERWAKVLPDVRGLQRTAWSHTWTTEKVCRLQLFAYDQGFHKPRLIWKTDPPEDTIFQPLNVVYDVDGDGVQEICVAAHYRLMIFEGTTGRKETELRYHTCRPYGWFGLADVDADGQVELITIGDFQSHLDVLKFDPGKPENDRLSIWWRRDIETDISQRRKWPQVGPRPVVDVNGDGRLEIILNLYNDTGDEQWHTVIWDGSSGKVLHDFPSRFTRGNADVDGDGAAEIFMVESDGLFVPSCGLIELVALKGGQPRTVWTRKDAGWVTADLLAFGPMWSTTACDGMKHVLTAGSDAVRPAFATWSSGESGGRSRMLSLLRADEDGRIQTLWDCAGWPEDAEAVAMGPIGADGAAGMLLCLRLGLGVVARIDGHRTQPRLVKDEPLSSPISMPVAARLAPGGPMAIVVEAAGGQVLAMQPQPDGSAHILWQRPGRGMTDGSRAVGPLAADLDGDGGNEVIVADRAPRGHAVLVAYRSDGSPLWKREFPTTPGGPVFWNTGALTYWWPGCFREPGKTDLFVNTRRGPMHSDLGHLLDGRTGDVVWTQLKAVKDGIQWGYSGIPLATADINANGRDELVNLYPVAFWTADGRDGKLIAIKDLSSRKDLPAWAAYGEPMVRDFNGDGRPEVLLDSVYILALLDTAGSPIWHGPGRADYPTVSGEGNVDETTSVRHALIDFDGDGRFEIASAGYGNGVRAIDPAGGNVLWSLKAPTPTCLRCSSVDIDGRPGDELLYVAGDTLVAVTGDRTAGRLLWEWKGSANLSLPAIADTDADGQAEIILQAADGTVCCLDSTATH